MYDNKQVSNDAIKSIQCNEFYLSSMHQIFEQGVHHIVINIVIVHFYSIDRQKYKNQRRACRSKRAYKMYDIQLYTRYNKKNKWSMYLERLHIFRFVRV